jgi:hypothetical protein
MSSANVYDVTEWSVGNPYEDIGTVINGIIADIKRRQTQSDLNDRGKPGAVIYIPPGADRRIGTRLHVFEHPVQHAPGRAETLARNLAGGQPHSGGYFC